MGHKTENARVFNPDQVLLADISYKSFTYPGDEEALAAMKAIPGAAPLLTYLQQNFNEQLVFLSNNDQMVRAGRHNFPSLYALLERCCEVLSCPVPELYITTSPIVNAYTQGQRRTCIVLHSALINTLSVDELSFVIGHEIGHIKCAHGLYRLLGNILMQYWDLLVSVIPVPGLGLLRIPLLLAYWEWYRRAEFTCDRAGLLCVQDIEPCLTGLGRLAGTARDYKDEFDVDATIRQVEAHKEVKNKLVVLVSIWESMQNTHPFVPARLKQLKKWAASEEYAEILRGDYIKDRLGLHEGGERIKCECGTIVNSKLSFCPECGRSLAKDEADEAAVASKCSKCGEPLEAGVKFCPKCGTKNEGGGGDGNGGGADDLTPLDKLKNTANSFFKKS
jgi:Zn-dependent protease with chaperone function